MAALQARPRLEVGVLVVCGLVVGVAIEAGLGAPSSAIGAGTGSTAAHLLKMVEYFAAFAALPWSRALHSVAAGGGLGLCMLAAAAWSALRVRNAGDEPSATLTQAGLALVTFGLLTAALAAIGRVDELPTFIVPTRYTPFAAMLQIGMLLSAAGELARLQKRGPFAVAMLALLSLALLAGDIVGARALRRASNHLQAASEAFDAGRPSDIQIHPRPAFAAAVRAELKVRGRPD